MACTWHPSNRCYYVTIVLSIKDLLNVSSDRIPEINSLCKANSKNIILTPIQQVKIIIIDNVRCIEYLFWELGDTSYGLLLLLCLFLSKRLNQRDVLMKRHGGPRPLSLERKNSLICPILLLLRPLLAISDSRETKLFILGLLQGKGIGRAALCREHALGHELLKTLLLLMT